MPLPSPLGIDKRTGKSIRAIIVDDSKLMRIMLTKILLSEQFEIIAEAVNGEDGERIINSIRRPPNLIITDIDMPKKNGIEMLQSIKSKLENTKILVSTAKSDNDTVKAILEIGVDGYILKPFTREDVLLKIHIALNKH